MDLNVDGARRLLNVSPEEMSDDALRLALVRLADDFSPPDMEPAEVAQRLRTFAEALNRAGFD
jgi:hypothetical protein